MKLVMTLLVRDEKELHRLNIAHHLDQGVDFIIAMDNLSVDGTRDILLEYEKRGVLHYLYQAGDDFAQDRWVTTMARMAATQFGATWVINNDADEFWFARSGTLRTVLSAVPDGVSALSAERFNFLPHPQGGGELFANFMTVREKNSRNAHGKPLPPKVCHRAFTDIIVAPGNHSAARHGVQILAHSSAIDILHFPMRSYRQFEDKVRKGGEAIERNTTRAPYVASTWRRLYALYSRGELPAYYAQFALDDAAVAKGLVEGRLVTDTRLRDFASKLRAGA
jgi:hypothetical protein